MSYHTNTIEIKALGNWNTYFNGNNKYPKVSILQSVDQIDDQDDLLEHINLLTRTLDNRVKAIDIAFTGGSSWSPAPVNANFDDKPVIVVPSGGKDTAWMKDAAHGNLPSGSHKKFKPWWCQMLEKGAYVIFVVSVEEESTYNNALSDAKLSTTYTDRIQVKSYPGAGIGWGRYAATKMMMHIGKPYWIVDDRVQSLYWYCNNARITTPDNLAKVNRELMNHEFYGWKPLLFSHPFPNSGVATFINPLWHNKVVVPEVKDVKAELCKELFNLVINKGFVFCKEDTALYTLLEDIFYPIITPKVTDFNIVHGVKTDTRNPTYQNTVLNLNTLPKQKRKMIDALSQSNDFTYDKNGTSSILSWEVLKDNYKFKNVADMIKMQDAAMFALIEVIVAGYKKLMGDSPISTKKLNSKKPPTDMLKLLRDWNAM